MPEAIGVRAWAGAGYRVWRGLLRRCDSGGRVVLPRSKLEHVHHPGAHVCMGAGEDAGAGAGTVGGFVGIDRLAFRLLKPIPVNGLANQWRPQQPSDGTLDPMRDTQP